MDGTSQVAFTDPFISLAPSRLQCSLNDPCVDRRSATFATQAPAVRFCKCRSFDTYVYSKLFLCSHLDNLSIRRIDATPFYTYCVLQKPCGESEAEPLVTYKWRFGVGVEAQVVLRVRCGEGGMAREPPEPPCPPLYIFHLNKRSRLLLEEAF